MKNITAFALVLFIWFIGELISMLIYNFIMIPGSILGFILMFLLLQLGIIKIELISDLADFFMKHITLLLIPLLISFITHFDVIGSNIALLLLTGIGVSLISLMITMKFVDILVRITDTRRKRHE